MLHIAVIGCGGVGGLHIARWSNLSGVRIAAVCDRDPSRAHRAATEFGAEAHTDWQSLLNESHFDAVDVCVPVNERSEIASLAMNNGANVLCERPLGEDSLQAGEMSSLAQSRNLLLMPAFSYRFDPSVLFAMELVRNDDLGRVMMLRSRLTSVPPQGDTGAVEFSNPVLFDSGLDCIDLFRYFAGDVERASGQEAGITADGKVAAATVIAMKAENGAIGTVECSSLTSNGTNVLEIHGTAGACIVDHDMGRVRFRTAEMAVWETRDISGLDRYERMLGHFADSVRGIQTPEITSRDGFRALEIAEKVRYEL